MADSASVTNRLNLFLQIRSGGVLGISGVEGGEAVEECDFLVHVQILDRETVAAIKQFPTCRDSRGRVIAHGDLGETVDASCGALLG